MIPQFQNLTPKIPKALICHNLKREKVFNVTVTSAFSSKSKHFTINFKSYIPETYFSRDKDDYKLKSKITLAKNIINYAISKNINFTYVCFNLWYTASELLEFIDSNNLFFVFKIKFNKFIKFYRQIKNTASSSKMK